MLPSTPARARSAARSTARGSFFIGLGRLSVESCSSLFLTCSEDPPDHLRLPATGQDTPLEGGVVCPLVRRDSCPLRRDSYPFSYHKRLHTFRNVDGTRTGQKLQIIDLGDGTKGRDKVASGLQRLAAIGNLPQPEDEKTVNVFRPSTYVRRFVISRSSVTVGHSLGGGLGAVLSLLQFGPVRESPE